MLYVECDSASSKVKRETDKTYVVDISIRKEPSTTSNHRNQILPVRLSPGRPFVDEGIDIGVLLLIDDGLRCGLNFGLALAESEHGCCAGVWYVCVCV